MNNYNYHPPPWGSGQQDVDYFSLGRPYGGGYNGQQQRPRSHHGQRQHHYSRHSKGGWGISKKNKNNSHTDLQKLRHDNAGQARKHFASAGNFGPGRSLQTPRSVPPAPENDNRFLTSTTGALVSPAVHASGFHIITPNPFAPDSSSQGFWKNSFSTVDKEAAELGALAGFDMYGSNAGLIARLTGTSDEEDNGFESTSDAEDEPYTLQEADTPLGPAARAKIEEQAAYIAELEERNLNLQERVYLLEQQLAELRKTLPAEASDHSNHSSEEDAQEEVEAEHIS